MSSPIPLRRSARIAARDAALGIPPRLQSQGVKKQKTGGASRSMPTPPADPQLAYLDFSLKVFRAAASNSSIAISPSSIGTALALLLEGAGGETKDEIIDFLGQGGSASVRSFYATLTAGLAAHRKLYARAANSVFVDEKFEVKDEFAKCAEKVYSATIKNMDLKRGAHSAQVVNDLISTATKGLIKGALNADSFTPKTAMMLLNTTTFEGKWEQEFAERSTHKGTFKGLAGDRKETFMREKDCYQHYSISRELAVAELKYKDPAWSLFLLMPFTGYVQWLATLTAAKISEAMASVSGGKRPFRGKRNGPEFELIVPKFSLDVAVDFKAILAGGGVVSCFSPASADFTGLADGTLFVQDVQQKVVFVMDEGGTRAAGGTFFMPSSCDVEKRIDFKQPFLFILARNKTPIFFGHFV